MNYRQSPIALAIALGFSAHAVAQETKPQELPTITVTADREQGYVAPRSSTATKTDTPLRDTPQSISVITQAQISDQGSQGLAEALRYTPGISFAQGEGNRETPIFRGVSTTADFFVDGVRDDVQYYRDLYNIENVEVFRGPNAMIFGRGATGGLINRVTKTANWKSSQAASLTLGSYNNRRVTADLNQAVNDTVALRVNAMHEHSESYRDGVWLKRSGVNPTVTIKASPRTLITLGYEHFEDERVPDRGIPSFQGKPVDTARNTFFGNADGSRANTRLDALSAVVEHEFGGGALLRNRTRWADQDKFYQNVYPDSVNAAGTLATIKAYNNATARNSFFNQTDLTFKAHTGAIQHQLLTGLELGTQKTDNLRKTGTFAGNVTSVTVPLGSPSSAAPISYSPAASDANNTSTADIVAIYVQDQMELTPRWHVIGGLRYEQFSMNFRNNRNNDRFTPTDSMLSPRLGVVYKPSEATAIYANYSVAYLPRSGDQMTSLSATNQSFEPEKFKNTELGIKWDVRRNLAATAAVFCLDRSNVVILDPTDATNTRTILSEGQRTEGLELSLTGQLSRNWNVAAGYAYTEAKFIGRTSATLAVDGRVAQVPAHSVTLWNRYDFNPTWGAALGVIHRTKVYAANEQVETGANAYPNVELPGYTRLDAAVFYQINKKLKMQMNVENLTDRHYYSSAHNNNNITPSAPRSLRFSVNAAF